MIIAKNLLDKWNQLKEHNDIKLISEQFNISRVTISNALRSGEASSQTIFAIDKFYRTKQKKLTKLKSNKDENNKDNC